MSTIDNLIREEIRKAAADSPEARNEIYLAAREAIQKLPSGNSESAMTELFETVKTIEAEIARRELAIQAEAHAIPERKKRSWSLSDVKIPWTLIAIITVIVCTMAFSANLVWKEYQKRLTEQRPTSSNTDKQIERIFLVSKGDDLTKMARAPGRTSQVTNNVSNLENKLKFRGKFELYGIDTIPLRRDSIYLVKLTLDYTPRSGKLVLDAGFAKIHSDGNQILRSSFLNNGVIGQSSFRPVSSDHFFSSLVSFDDLSDDLKIFGNETSVYPFIIADVENQNTEILIKSFSIDKVL
ncbi:MAG: hypothetical protein AAF423_07020 [Pseudomonadota bacterium]